MEKHLEGVSNLDKARTRFEGLADNYINNLSALAERRREAQAEAQVKKAKDLELKKELAIKIDKLYRKLKKLGLFDEEKVH